MKKYKKDEELLSQLQLKYVQYPHIRVSQALTIKSEM